MRYYIVEWVTEGDEWRPAMRGWAHITASSKKEMVDQLAKRLVQRDHVNPDRLDDIHYRIEETVS